jgi:hypothetical protein
MNKTEKDQFCDFKSCDLNEIDDLDIPRNKVKKYSSSNNVNESLLMSNKGNIKEDDKQILIENYLKDLTVIDFGVSDESKRRRSESPELKRCSNIPKDQFLNLREKLTLLKCTKSFNNKRPLPTLSSTRLKSKVDKTETKASTFKTSCEFLKSFRCMRNDEIEDCTNNVILTLMNL